MHSTLFSGSVICIRCYSILGLCKVCHIEHRTAHLNVPPPLKVKSLPDLIPDSGYEPEISELSFLGETSDCLILLLIKIIVCC